MLLFLTFIALGDYSLKHVRQVVLKTEVTSVEPTIFVDRDQNIFYADYWGHKVTKMDRNGSVLFSMGSGSGHGPGELFKPNFLSFFQNEKVMYVWGAGGQVQTFSTSTGEYLEFIGKIQANILVPRQDGFLTVGNGLKGRYIHRISSRGENLKNWYPSLVYNPKKVSVSIFRAVWHRGLLYHSEGTFPEIWVIKDGAEIHQNWELTPPRYYREPPKKPMNPAWRFNREKVDSFLNSFTKIWNLGLVEDRFLAVCWDIRTPHLGSLDLYSLEGKERKRVVANAPLSGLLAWKNGSFLYMLEKKEAKGEEEDDQHIVHIYKLEKS